MWAELEIQLPHLRTKSWEGEGKYRWFYGIIYFGCTRRWWIHVLFFMNQDDGDTGKRMLGSFYRNFLIFLFFFPFPSPFHITLDTSITITFLFSLPFFLLQSIHTSKNKITVFVNKFCLGPNFIHIFLSWVLLISALPSFCLQLSIWQDSPLFQQCFLSYVIFLFYTFPMRFSFASESAPRFFR